MLVSHSVPAMTGGISQQPASLRFPDQAEDIKNGWPSLTKGMQKRPPSDLYGQLLGPDWDINSDDPAFHFVDRDSSERYLVSVCENDGDDERLRVHNLLTVAGGNISKANVRFSRSAYNYLDATSSDAYRFQTIGDVTFVVNREKTVAMSSRVEPTRTPQAMLFVRATLSSSSHEDVIVSFNGATTGPIHDPDASTTALASNIYAALTGTDVNAGSWTIDHHANKFLQTNHTVTVGKAIRFSLASGSAWFEWTYWVETTNDDNTVSRTKYTGRGSAYKTFYVVATGSNWIKVATEPGGEAINLRDVASTSTFGSNVLGTGTPPSGFADLNIATMPLVSQQSHEDSYGNILILSHKDGEDFDLTVRDAAGDTLVSVYKDTTPSFTELPDTCMHGFRLRVVNDPGTGLDDYLVEFVGDNGPGEISKGYWKEIAEPDEPIEFDPRTMPHLLVRGADGVFTFIEAGDTEFPIESIEGANPNELVISTGVVNHPLGLTGNNAVLLADGDEIVVRGTERLQVTGTSGTVLVPEDKTYWVQVLSTDSNTQTIKLYSDPGLGGGKIVDISDLGSGAYGALYRENVTGYNWGVRPAGDALTNPEPAFVGTQIRDVAYYKNRLVFLAGENVICSEAGAFFGFWRTTVATLLDSDPIDIASAVSQIASLQAAVPYGNQLWITGRRMQLALGPAQGQPLSPRTADLQVVSNYEVEIGRKPIIMGTSLYAPFRRGEYIGLYDFHYDPQIEGRFEGNDATEHVPHLIEGDIRGMAALEREGVLAVIPKDAGNLWVYKTFRYNGNPVQQAWAHYTFYNADIRAAHFYDNQMYMVVGRVTHGSTTWWIDKIDFKPDAVDSGSQYLNYIDRKYSYTSTVDEVSADGSSTVLGSIGTLPDMEANAPMEVIGTDGVRHTVTAVTADTITIRGAHGGKTFWIGERYALEYDFGTIYVRERRTPTGQANIAITSGRTHLRRGRIKYGDSSYFRVEVTDRNGQMFSYPFTGRQLGDSLLKVGGRPESTGTFDFPINGKNDEMTIKLVNDSPFASNLTGADFDSNFVLRGRRI